MGQDIAIARHSERTYARKMGASEHGETQAAILLDREWIKHNCPHCKRMLQPVIDSSNELHGLWNNKAVNHVRNGCFGLLRLKISIPSSMLGVFHKRGQWSQRFVE